MPNKFQSTHPSRGATLLCVVHVAIHRVSIHAPLAGCDVLRFVRCRFIVRFNPRTPRGVRHVHLEPPRLILSFNPRTPRGVRLHLHVTYFVREDVSIHAPLAGCDTSAIFIVGGICGFNPRTPRGVRLRTPRFDRAVFAFQSTHPSRGATLLRAYRLIRFLVSIHAPLAGCDPASGGLCCPLLSFNPRTPRGVRPEAAELSELIRKFQSTHPSRGATQSIVETICTLTFQSTHPSRGATIPFGEDVYVEVFQSTHPSRGATATETTVHVVGKFQSTHPSRGATVFCRLFVLRLRVSIHAPLAGCDLQESVTSVDCLYVSIHAPLAGCDIIRPTAGRDDHVSIHAPLAGCDY